MEEIAPLLGSTAIKQRLAGVTELLGRLRSSEDAPTSAEPLATLIPHVLPCLRDHNSKIALSALEILELLVTRVAETTLRSYFKLLWTSVVERLGDNKLPVREKAVNVVVEISGVLDIPMILEKLKACMQHKNWRTREQSLHAVWRCLERHNLFKEKQDELLDDVGDIECKVLKLLEDSSKDVRNAAVTALEKFYTYIGPSLLSDLEYKKIRSAHMRTLADRFERIPVPGRAREIDPVISNKVESGYGTSDIPEANCAVPDEITSILSTYDLQVSSSSSMARYLASVRSRTQNEAKAEDLSGGDELSSPQAPPIASVSVGVNDNGISEREIQKQLGMIFDKLQLDNNWSIRVDGLKMLQKLAVRCSKAPNSDTALPTLSQGIRSVRERLCEQVSDLRSSVSREACQTIQTLANSLRDEFNGHAEICLGNLLKATYVTIQVISTSADTTIRSMIESTNSGYARVIPKLIECVKTRNQVLRYNAVCYLTLALQRWSQSFLAKHADMFPPILPAILQDAVGDVRAQSRKCYWSYHYLFPDEAKSVFDRLDASTQRNLRDDPSRYHASDARQTDWSSLTAPATQNAQHVRSSNRANNAPQPPLSAPAAVNSVLVGGDNHPTNLNAQRVYSSGDAASVNLPRRVLGTNSRSTGGDIAEENSQNARMLSQGPMRVGLAARKKASQVSKDGQTSTNEKKQTAPVGPLRVFNAPKPSQVSSTSTENLLASRQEPSTASYHTSSQNQVTRAQRIQLPAEIQEREAMDIDDGEPKGPKRLPLASMPSPTASNVSSTKTNGSGARKATSKDSSDMKSKTTRATTVKPLERENTVVPTVFDQLDEALQNIGSKSWSVRLEAAEYIGREIQKRFGKSVSGTSNEQKVNNRIVTAFIKHLSDPHYRVSQEVLKHFLLILKLSNDNQRLIPLLKTILPKLFQKFVDTKESVREMAKENLEYIALAVESSTLAAVVISMLGDGSNMKVKAAMCHYLRELLPEAGSYMKQGANNSHMRSFLLKIALLVDADVPVSVASACGELVSVAAKLYGSEMETALGLLPPSKRAVVSKVLKSRKIILNSNNFHRPPTPPQPAPPSTRSRDGDNDNQAMDATVPKPERSRKRPESPSVSSSSPPRQNSQKRMYTTAGQDMGLDSRLITAAGDGIDKSATKSTQQVKMEYSTALFASTTAEADQDGVQLEEILHVLEQNNSSDVEVKNALCKAVHFIETGSSETWDRCFGRLLLLLLDIATDKVYAWKVVKKLVETQRARAQMFFELLLQRLVDAMNDQVDLARHLMERILHDLVRNSSDKEQTLATLVTLISSTEPPALQVVLCLITLCLESCERGAPEETDFLLKPDVANGVLGALTRCLSHASSKARKNAVDCLVAYHFATKKDSTVMNKYLSAALDDNRRRLVGIFIDRANMERRHIGLSS